MTTTKLEIWDVYTFADNLLSDKDLAADIGADMSDDDCRQENLEYYSPDSDLWIDCDYMVSRKGDVYHFATIKTHDTTYCILRDDINDMTGHDIADLRSFLTDHRHEWDNPIDFERYGYSDWLEWFLHDSNLPLPRIAYRGGQGYTYGLWGKSAYREF